MQKPTSTDSSGTTSPPGEASSTPSGNSPGSAGPPPAPNASPRRGPRRWKRGELDLWHVLIGRNGCGKSTRGRALAAEYARQGCRILVSDPDGQFTALARQSFASTDAYREFLRKNAGTNVPLVARFTDEVAIPDLLDLARELSAASRYVTPSVVVIDEGTAWSEATKKTQADKTLLRASGRRRNDAVGVILLQQQPSMLNFQSMANATQIDVYRLESDYAIRHLLAQFPKECKLKDGQVIDRDALALAIPKLERGEYYAIDKSFQ